MKYTVKLDTLTIEIEARSQPDGWQIGLRAPGSISIPLVIYSPAVLIELSRALGKAKGAWNPQKAEAPSATPVRTTVEVEDIRLHITNTSLEIEAVHGPVFRLTTRLEFKMLRRAIDDILQERGGKLAVAHEHPEEQPEPKL